MVYTPIKLPLLVTSYDFYYLLTLIVNRYIVRIRLIPTYQHKQKEVDLG